MKRRRWLIAAGIVAVGCALALPWGRPAQHGSATPADCILDYAEACKAGDVPRYLSCLTESLRAVEQPKDAEELKATLRQRMREVKSWVQQPAAEIKGSRATVDVDEIRVSGSCRVRFHLERTGAGWLIAGIDTPRDLPTTIRYGTHVSEAVNGDPPRSEP